jgi:hypothetical protein
MKMCSPLRVQSLIKYLSYEAGRDDRVIDISKFTYGVGTSHVCVMQYTKFNLASLACVDMASKHGISKGRAWVARLCN